jgi:GDP-D-mannose 3',5'-epimerase
MTGKRVLVTGGAGMIGSQLVKRLVSMDCEVSIVDNLWRGKLTNLLDGAGRFVVDLDCNFYNRDLTLPGALDDLVGKVDYVFHLADVVAGIGYVFKNEGFIFRQNLLINSNVVASVRLCNTVKGFIYAGTACSFPAAKQTGVDALPLREEDQYPAAPESGYGWSKLMGEYEALLMERETGIPVAVVVLHNVYGAPCDFDAKTSQVIPALIQKAIRFPEEPFVVWGSGAQGRAFVHVTDVVDGLVSAMERGLGHGPIQLGPDTCTSIRQIAETIVRISGKPIEIYFDTTRPEGDKGRCANYEKAMTLLGWRPRTSLNDGLSETYKWILGQPKS